MGHCTSFEFTSAEEIWNEVRAIWPKGGGISYARLDREGGLQWPCTSETDPGQTILHAQTFPHGTTASLRRLEYQAAPEMASEDYPFLADDGTHALSVQRGHDDHAHS